MPTRSTGTGGQRFSISGDVTGHWIINGRDPAHPGGPGSSSAPAYAVGLPQLADVSDDLCSERSPTCSWLNAVETVFARLRRRPLKRGMLHSIVDLQAAINRCLEDHNAEPKPFVWTAAPNMIPDKRPT